MLKVDIENNEYLSFIKAKNKMKMKIKIADKFKREIIKFLKNSL